MSVAIQGHAVVTGASKGIGAAIAKAFAARGVSLTLLSRSRRFLDNIAAKLDKNANVISYCADVSDEESVFRAVAYAREKFGPITILVNNAGQVHSAPLTGTTISIWKTMLDVNLTGAYLCIRHVLPDMLASNAGTIVNVSSTAGLTGYPYVSAYCAAKHGLIGLTRALALELARKNITVNAVCPGYTETDLLRESIGTIQNATNLSRAEVETKLKARNPQGRFIRAEEVAAAVMWLCSADARSVTGQSLVVAGGEVM